MCLARKEYQEKAAKIARERNSGGQHQCSRLAIASQFIM